MFLSCLIMLALVSLVSVVCLLAVSMVFLLTTLHYPQVFHLVCHSNSWLSTFQHRIPCFHLFFHIVFFPFCIPFFCSWFYSPSVFLFYVVFFFAACAVQSCTYGETLPVTTSEKVAFTHLRSQYSDGSPDFFKQVQLHATLVNSVSLFLTFMSIKIMIHRGKQLLLKCSQRWNKSAQSDSTLRNSCTFSFPFPASCKSNKLLRAFYIF